MRNYSRGMLLYQPEHKVGVLAAIKGYMQGKMRKQRRQHRIGQRKHYTGRLWSE